MSGNNLSKKRNKRSEKIRRMLRGTENLITAHEEKEDAAFKQFANGTRNTAKTQQTVVTNNTIVDKTDLTSLSGS